MIHKILRHYMYICMTGNAKYCFVCSSVSPFFRRHFLYVWLATILNAVKTNYQPKQQPSFKCQRAAHLQTAASRLRAGEDSKRAMWDASSM